jgi:hypothetical protein
LEFKVTAWASLLRNYLVLHRCIYFCLILLTLRNLFNLFGMWCCWKFSSVIWELKTGKGLKWSVYLLGYDMFTHILEEHTSRKLSKQVVSCYLFAELTLQTWRGWKYISLKREYISTRLHGIVLQKIVLHIITTMRSSNLIRCI